MLDTHSFLWFISNNPRLSVKAKETISNALDCYVSICSLWEIAIKVSLNKLVLPTPYQQYIPEQLQINEFKILPIEFRHTIRQSFLPRYHGDPFDRMLISQAMEENLILISNDSKLTPYGASVLW